jgi:hypothetical protein
MQFNVAHLITDSGILIFVDGKQFQIAQDHPNFRAVKTKLENRDYSDLTDLLDIRAAVRKWLGINPRFTLTNDLLALDGVEFSDRVSQKVLAMIDAGNDPQALFNFLVKVRQNPSNTAQNELLLFCSANKFMIHADGDILSYKAVRQDYKDIHSGSVFYKPCHLMTADERAKYDVGITMGREKNVRVSTANGITEVSMPRFAVDDNRERTCSHGLHFAALGYASSFGGVGSKMLVLKVNPADVVSIPSDYNNEKGRTAKLVVAAELDRGTALPEKEVYNDDDLWWGTDECDECDNCGRCC